MWVLSNCDIHILFRELSILIRELKHCMLSNSFRRAFKTFELVAPAARAEKPPLSLARQDKKEAVMTGPTPECTHNARDHAAATDAQTPARHRRRSEARRRQAGEQAKGRGQNIELANGENDKEENQPKPVCAAGPSQQ